MPRRGPAAGRSRSAGADGSAPCAADSAPLSGLATLSLPTSTPLPGCACEQAPASCRRSRAPLCGIFRPRAALERNKPHVSATEVPFSHICHRSCSASALRLPTDRNSLHSDTQRSARRFSSFAKNLHRCWLSADDPRCPPMRGNTLSNRRMCIDTFLYQAKGLYRRRRPGRPAPRRGAPTRTSRQAIRPA
jgi:hypothetical protein